MKMRYVGYKTVDAIMAEIKERIYQAIIEDYEDVTIEELERMSYKDILNVHNHIYGESLTLDEIKEMVC